MSRHWVVTSRNCLYTCSWHLCILYVTHQISQLTKIAKKKTALFLLQTWKLSAKRSRWFPNTFILSNRLKNKAKQANTSSSSYHFCRCHFLLLCNFNSCQVNSLWNEIRNTWANFFIPLWKAVSLTWKTSRKNTVYRCHVPHNPPPPLPLSFSLSLLSSFPTSLPKHMF